MNVLATGAHPDDIEHGCGGTLRKLTKAGDKVYTVILTDGANNGHRLIRRDESFEAAAVLGTQLTMLGLPDGELKCDRTAISTIEGIINLDGIDTVFVHAPDDSHQDHRATTEIVVAAARKLSNVLFYQSPSTLSFQPTVFVDIADTLTDKVRALECHDSQVRGSLMIEPDVLPGTARYWGMQSRLGQAEGFVPLRLEIFGGLS